MKYPRKTFSIFGNTYQQKKAKYVETIIEVLKEYNADIYIEDQFYDFISKNFEIDLSNIKIYNSHNCCIDIAISMGGDGTFLKTSSIVGQKGIPILGINIGRLGFMANIAPTEITKAIELIYKNEFEIEERTVLQVTSDNYDLLTTPYALNEIAILKHDNSSTIDIKAYISDNYLTNYIADGLIITTPTGSTGYSLSVGGPIVSPNTNTITISPVAPHSLSVRPIVLRDSIEIDLSVDSRTHNYLVAIDGRSESVPDATKLKITKADYTVKVIKIAQKSFYTTLREKLMWGADSRN